MIAKIFVRFQESLFLHIISDVAFNYAMSELPGIGIFGGMFKFFSREILFYVRIRQT